MIPSKICTFLMVLVMIFTTINIICADEVQKCNDQILYAFRYRFNNLVPYIRYAMEHYIDGEYIPISMEDAERVKLGLPNPDGDGPNYAMKFYTSLTFNFKGGINSADFCKQNYASNLIAKCMEDLKDFGKSATGAARKALLSYKLSQFDKDDDMIKYEFMKAVINKVSTSRKSDPPALYCTQLLIDINKDVPINSS